MILQRLLIQVRERVDMNTFGVVDGRGNFYTMGRSTDCYFDQIKIGDALHAVACSDGTIHSIYRPELDDLIEALRG